MRPLLALVLPMFSGLALLLSPIGQAEAWGGLGHRAVAAIAADLLPPDKVARMNTLLSQLEIDNNFVDAASYPDEYIRGHAPQFNNWHFSDLPDDGSAFDCKNDCLYSALAQNLAILRQGNGDKAEAVALAWVIHLVGDLHQPLHMDARLRGGNNFHVTYRKAHTCQLYSGGRGRAELHSVWDDCLVSELANGKSPQALASAVLNGITSYSGRPEVANPSAQPWLAWGGESHALALSVAFGQLQDGADLENDYIVGDGKALDVVDHQLLRAGIRLAYLLDQNVN